jgi:hypothetical protein
MNDPTLDPKQSRALLQLAFREGHLDKVSDLKPKLDPKFRRELSDLKLLAHKKVKRSSALELTDNGWRWVMDHLDSDLPKTDQMLNGVLKRLHQFLQTNSISVQDVILNHPLAPARETPPEPVAQTVKEALLQAAQELGGAHAAQIRLRDLRPKLHHFSRQDVDAAILALHQDETISVIPIDLPTDIDAHDTEAAIEIAGRPRHAIIIRER